MPAAKAIDTDVVGPGRAIDNRTVKYHHTMLVRVEGMPRYFQVWLCLSQDGELWLDASNVGGAFPAEREVFAVGFDGAYRYARAHVSGLEASEGRRPRVTATIASC